MLSSLLGGVLGLASAAGRLGTDEVRPLARNC